jgi:hypothetical protein
LASPLEHLSRTYAVYLRGPAPANSIAFATKDDIRAGVQHLGRLTVMPAPSDNMESDFGILVGGSFTVEIADEDSAVDWYLLYENGDRILLEDASGLLTLE